MMSYDVLLLAAAAASTALILFGVVIMGDVDTQHQHAKANIPPQRRG
jgi:hypothetical protein